MFGLGCNGRRAGCFQGGLFALAALIALLVLVVLWLR
jgi:hypothetical protein